MYCRRQESVKGEIPGMIDVGDHSTDQVTVYNIQSSYFTMTITTFSPVNEVDFCRNLEKEIKK